jgi:hypothetical protein
MADQRDLHDIEQVVPAIFDADIRRWPRSPRWPVFKRRTPPWRISRSNRFRGQQVPVRESMDLGGC